MKTSLQEDEHTDVQNNWIEECILYVAECCHAKIINEEIYKALFIMHNLSIEERQYIMAAGKLLFQDEIKEEI